MSACSASSGLIADSTLAIISVAGMLVGVTAKFNPFFQDSWLVEEPQLSQLLLTENGRWVV